jgi:nucleoside-diphosphate-sugar epimerase
VKVLVTGGTGFVGSHLLRALVRQNFQVSVLVRKGSAVVYSDLSPPFVDSQLYDGTIRSLERALRESKPDVVIHLASLYITEHSAQDISNLISSNITLSTDLVEAMVNFGVRRFINTGTSWQHYRNLDYCPVNLYAATKQAFESILSFYTDARGLEVISLKLFDTYGPFDKRQKLFSHLRRAASTEDGIEMSAGEQLIDLVYIDDVVSAYLIALDQFRDQGGSRSYAITSGNLVSLRKLVEIYEGTTGHRLNISWGSRPYRSREVMMPWQGGPLLPTWTPKIDLVEGIRRMETVEGNPPIFSGRLK